MKIRRAIPSSSPISGSRTRYRTHACLGEPPQTFDTLIARTPADPAWREGGLYHDDMGWGVPALWFNSWYDVSIGPNLELFNHARASATDAAHLRS